MNKPRGEFVEYLKIGAVRLKVMEFLRSAKGKRQLAAAARLRRNALSEQSK